MKKKIFGIVQKNTEFYKLLDLPSKKCGSIFCKPKDSSVPMICSVVIQNGFYRFIITGLYNYIAWHHMVHRNAFPHDTILDQTKLKASADDQLDVTKTIIYVFDRIENIVRKEEIVCTSNFSFSHNVFKRLLSQTRQKVSLSGNGINLSQTSPGFYMPTV